MLIKKEVSKVMKSGEIKYDLHFNKEFWQKTIDEHGAINIIIDEAHQFLNPRRSMSKINVIMGDFLGLIRRILGSNDSGYGECILITQLERRIDCIAKDLANNVSYSVCHYVKRCRCGFEVYENNEVPEQMTNCLRCGKPLRKEDHIIEVWKFKNIDSYNMWKLYGGKTYYKRLIINDIERYFKYYNTLQWDDMFSELYC